MTSKDALPYLSANRLLPRREAGEFATNELTGERNGK